MSVASVWHECLCFAIYYAPRGRPRLLMLGESIGQRYLSPTDRLVGILGESGTGKSSLISGMFPGLELTNDDEGVNVRPAPLIRMHRDGRFRAHTFHIDARFEMAFTQPYEIADAIRAALDAKRRVVVEHFDAIYPTLGINAPFLLGIGEEIIVARPNLFGPFPEDICRVIADTAIYRKMAHSAEDLTSLILEKDFGISAPAAHSDVPRGFVIEFAKEPEGLDIAELERKARHLVEAGLDISYADSGHIRIGEDLYPCNGPRIHVGNTAEIKNFRLLKDLVYDHISGLHCLVGLVAEMNPMRFIERHPETSIPMPPAAP